jgi:cyclopropane fatty-acyl-phospholipid synthase-like methyltransferase
VVLYPARHLKSMKDVTTSIVESLDGQDEQIFPHLPYLLQDLWEIGASPAHLIQMIKKNKLSTRVTKALDLGCGKGAVSIQLAKEFNLNVHGIDAMPAFIKDAKRWALKYDVKDLCQFELADIRLKVASLNGYDLIILGSIGPILGTVEESLTTLRPCLSTPGFILFDDAYRMQNESSSPHDYPTRIESLQQIDAAGYEILDELIYPPGFMRESNQEIFHAIQKRALELEEKFPQHKQLFRDYVTAQDIENNALENELVCVTWLLNI